jgi:pimeloyl-ACP methyl ester carboxylesterase
LVFVFKGYTIREKIKWFLGADFSMLHLFPEVLKNDLAKSSTHFAIPVYIMQGTYDYMTSQVLAKKYVEVIEAPKKGFFEFTNSAHSPNMEESEKFIEIMRGIAAGSPAENPI